MLGPEHCRRRVDRLRFAVISTRNPVAGARLRNFIEKYRVLAEQADKKVGSRSGRAVEQERVREKSE
jgi:hypothetical protein